MKKFIIALSLLLLPLCMKAQLIRTRSCFPGATVIDTFNAHSPTYFCHDDPWYDDPMFSSWTFSNTAPHCGPTGWDQPSIRAHVFVTDEPLEVLGIAGAPMAYYEGLFPEAITYDTTIAGREPEFFHLYEATPDTFMLVGEVRWDTCTQIRKYVGPDMTYDICEAYFFKPVTVEDSFYVGYTLNNNIYHLAQVIFADQWDGSIPVPTGVYTVYEHMVTRYGAIESMNERPRPVNRTVKYKLYCTNMDPYYDTLWHYASIPSNSNQWWLLWPIFDTTGMACQSVSQLAVTPIENQSTTLTWSAPSGQIIWDVQYGRSDAPRSSYTQTRVRNTPYLNLSNLDTGTYYTVFVRAMCDIGDYSNWSDSLVFYVPGDSSNVGIRAVEQYTNLFPNPANDQATVTSSFGIKGVEVYSLKGELMEHSTRDGGTVANIDLQRYPVGSYIVRIRTAKGIVARHLEVVR